jgi:hypothetical protein
MGPGGGSGPDPPPYTSMETPSSMEIPSPDLLPECPTSVIGPPPKTDRDLGFAAGSLFPGRAAPNLLCKEVEEESGLASIPTPGPAIPGRPAALPVGRAPRHYGAASALGMLTDNGPRPQPARVITSSRTGIDGGPNPTQAMRCPGAQCHARAVTGTVALALQSSSHPTPHCP